MGTDWLILVAVIFAYVVGFQAGRSQEDEDV